MIEKEEYIASENNDLKKTVIVCPNPKCNSVFDISKYLNNLQDRFWEKLDKAIKELKKELK